MRKCPNNKIHFTKECNCVPGNHFRFHEGRWLNMNQFYHIVKTDNHHMLSWSGLLTNHDFGMMILKIVLWCTLGVSILLGGIFWVTQKAANDLKKNEQHKIEQRAE